MQGIHLRKYGVETIINFELYEVDGVDFRTDAADAGSDCTIRKDQGADATCVNDFVDEGLSYSITITATEMEAKCITLHIIDSATKVWLDKTIEIETYGNASAQHAFDLDTASVAQSADNDTILATIEAGTPTLKYMGYYGPGVYIDSGAANENTVTGTDGIISHPVSTFAAARTIADAIGLNRYYLEGNSDITLAATHVDWEFCGVGAVADNTLNFGSQDVSRSRFCNLTLEGTQGGAARIEAIECALQDPGAGATTLHIFALRCGLVDDVEIDTSNNNVFESCFSLVAGAVTPSIIATGAAGTLELRHYSGGIELKTLSASHNVSIEGMGQVVFNADCNVNANVSIRGLFTITDNTAGMASLTQDAVVNIPKINIECDTALSDIDLDHLINASVADEVANDSIIAKLVSKDATADWSDYSWQTESFEALKDGILADILADTGELQTDDYPTSIAAIQTTVDAIKAETALIVADTNELQTDNIPGTLSTIDGIVDDILVDTAEIGSAVGASISADIAAIKAETALIVADTNELQTDDYPTSIAAIKAETALIVADTNELQTDDYPTSIATIDTVVDAIKVVTDDMAAAATTMIKGIVSWDNTNATTTVIYSSDIVEATADHFNGRLFVPTSGALVGQYTDITDYELSAGEGKFTVTALTEAPADNVTFVIL